MLFLTCVCKMRQKRQQAAIPCWVDLALLCAAMKAVTASDAGLRAPALHVPQPSSCLQLLFLRCECITEITGNIPGKREKW